MDQTLLDAQRQVAEKARQALVCVRAASSGVESLDALRQVAENLEDIERISSGNLSMRDIVTTIREEILGKGDLAGAEKMLGILAKVFPKMVSGIEREVAKNSKKWWQFWK